MNNFTIAVLFEGYAPFPLVNIFELFLIPYFLYISCIISSSSDDMENGSGSGSGAVSRDGSGAGDEF